MATRARFGGILAGLIVAVILASTFSVGIASGAPTVITAYKSTIPVNINGAYSPSQWTDTPTINEPISGVTFAVKQNGTGWLFLMIWQQSPGVCSDNACYGGIEIGPLTNTGVMGSTTTPTIMILGSPLFKGMVGTAVDEWISTGTFTPTSVESDGYATQSVCGALAVSGTTYTVQCYRPFTLKNASPYDFPTLGVGSTIEIGFAVGEFSSPGTHDATSMNSYTLTFSGSTYSGSSSTTSTTSTTPTTTTTTTTSTTRTTTTTTTTSTTPTTTSTTTTSTTKTTTTTTTPTTTTTTTTSTTPTTTSITSTSATSTGTGLGYTIKVATNTGSYLNAQTGVITVTIAPSPSVGSVVQLQITNPYKTPLFSKAATVAAGGLVSANFTTGNPYWEWVSGTYTVSASWSASGTTVLVGVAQFTYTGSSAPPATTTTAATSSTVTVTSTAPATTHTVTSTAPGSTQTVTSTAPGSTQTVTSTGPGATQTVTSTAPGSTQTVTSTGPGATQTVTGPSSTVTRTSTVTQTNSAIPAWAYGAMVLLLIVGLAVGYLMVGRMSRRPAGTA